MPPVKKRGRKKKKEKKKQVPQLFPQLLSTLSSSLSFLRRHDLLLSPSQSLSLESLLSSSSLSLESLLSHLPLPPSSPPLPPPPNPHSWFHRFLTLHLPQPKPIKTHQHSTFSNQNPSKSHLQDSIFPPQNNQDSDFLLPNQSILHLSSSKPFKLHQTNQDLGFSLWGDFFNLSHHSFNLLLQLLTPALSCLAPIQANYALAATLYRLAHAVSFSVVGRRFEMDAATACRAFYTVVKAINENLGHLFEFQEDISRVIVGFGWISLPNCCGVLGFERFGVDGEVLGENGSLLVQGLVDSEGRFLDVSAGWPSTLTADSILRKSMLFSGVEDSKDYLNGSSYNLSDGHSIPQYILGESSFPLLPWLLTPYRRSDENVELTETEMVFNSVHLKGIELVRKAFAKVKSRWKLAAKNSKEQCVEAFPDVIVACCLLHNFLIKSGDEGKLVEENVEFSGEQFFPEFKGDGDADGENVRDVLALHLCRVSQRR